MIRVLIVDDNAGHRLITRKWLESLSPGVFDVLEADNAEDGFAMTVRESPECVILDNIMTGADGFQTIHRMKKDLVHCPALILMTCALTEELKRNAMALGAAACFDKTNLDGPELVQTVMTAVIAARNRTGCI